MIKQYVGYSARTLMKVIGVEIYMISSARYVHEWMMKWQFHLPTEEMDIV